ncbi:MAG TPA: hypothetical protein VI603_06990 [Saprospiraceae bacterium]|nr:hypothetical protein [Saprospiraceae bacterium]
MKHLRCTLILLCYLSAHTLLAQQDVTRIAVFNIDLSEFKTKTSLLGTLFMLDMLKPNALNSIPEHLVRAYSNQSRFVVIDKKNYQLVTDERERQKSEDFIDGYVIDQGKSEGIDYLLRPRYNAVDNTITVRVFDVATGDVACEAQVEVIKDKVGPEHTSYYISILLEQLNSACFDLSYLVVRATDSKGDKVREILVAAGSGQQMKEKKVLEVFEKVDIVIEGKTKMRPVVVAECEIVVVEGIDFSVAKILNGGDVVRQKLDIGTPLYCRTKTQKK